MPRTGHRAPGTGSRTPVSFLVVRPALRLLLTLPLALSACQSGGGGVEQTDAAAAPTRPLGALVTQQVIVAPVNRLREADPTGWVRQIPRSREFLRAFDTALQNELSARGLGTRWVYAGALERAARSNPSHAVDPYALELAALRSTTTEAVPGKRLADPLASQLRTMIALQENARLLLLPVEISFDRLDDARGFAVLRLALVDGRTTEIRWIGDVRSEPSNVFSRELVLASLVARTADLIAAP